MLGLVPGIHEFPANIKTWMAGTSPAMTRIRFFCGGNLSKKSVAGDA
jgi:hypothetical protein